MHGIPRWPHDDRDMHGISKGPSLRRHWTVIRFCTHLGRSFQNGDYSFGLHLHTIPQSRQD
jgi:hypothetical protein